MALRLDSWSPRRTRHTTSTSTTTVHLFSQPILSTCSESLYHKGPPTTRRRTRAQATTAAIIRCRVGSVSRAVHVSVMRFDQKRKNGTAEHKITSPDFFDNTCGWRKLHGVAHAPAWRLCLCTCGAVHGLHACPGIVPCAHVVVWERL